jgi:hypothetical protein
MRLITLDPKKTSLSVLLCENTFICVLVSSKLAYLTNRTIYLPAPPMNMKKALSENNI